MSAADRRPAGPAREAVPSPVTSAPFSPPPGGRGVAGGRPDGDGGRGAHPSSVAGGIGATPETSRALQARVRSALPQRLRVEVPEIVADEARAAGLAVTLAKLPGVSGASVSALTGRALLHFAAPIDDLEAILRAVVEAAAQAV